MNTNTVSSLVFTFTPSFLSFGSDSLVAVVPNVGDFYISINPNDDNSIEYGFISDNDNEETEPFKADSLDAAIEGLKTRFLVSAIISERAKAKFNK